MMQAFCVGIYMQVSNFISDNSMIVSTLSLAQTIEKAMRQL